MKVIPNYHPPSDYRRPTKTQEKVYVPVNDYPEINFSMIANLLTLSYLSTVVTSASIYPMMLARQVIDCVPVLTPSPSSAYRFWELTY